MSPKIEKTGEMKRKNLNEAENVSHTEPTNLNNQSDPLDCSPSVRKKLNPNCNSRRILRSSKKRVETEKTLPGRLEPHMSPAKIVENSAVGGPEVIEEKDECSSLSLSLKLSDLVAMVGDDDDDDDDSETQSRYEDNVNAYQVKPEYMEILRKIIDKHGDIAKNCQAKSVKFRSMMLEIICEVISALDKKDVTNLKGVKKMIGQIDDVKEMKVEVEWLHTRLTEILEARQVFKQCGKLKEKIDNITGFTEIAESELKECEDEKKKLWLKLKEICDIEADWKKRLARMQEESIMASQSVKDAMSKVKRFYKRSLIDDLL
ncbi:uncharacterized protein LOC131607829 [Vicia villosa]|uniref:uncharacterized protein LOC131607829 n=1 Tax=Vicia villosa TaxID=3911 RepID=UPI00273AD079|nr:uncharacterized protein LOC131607829 [Vicia villosa]